MKWIGQLSLGKLMDKVEIFIGKCYEEGLFTPQSEIFFFHPLNQSLKGATQITYEVGSEEGIVALLCSYLSQKEKINDKEKAFLKSLDIGYLSSECNVAEEELEKIQKAVLKAKEVVIIAGLDLVYHQRSKNIQKILGILQKSYPLKSDFALLDSSCLEEIDEIGEVNGIIAYLQTKKNLKTPLLEASKQFALVGKICDNSQVEVNFLDKSLLPLKADFRLCDNFKGNVGILWLPNFDEKTFCYKQITLKKCEVA